MKLLLIFAALATTACAVSNRQAEPGVALPVEEVFYAEPETVDRAISQVMVKYPQKVANLEGGVLETDFIKGDARFKPAHRTINYGSGYRYKISVRTVRGKTEGKPAIKVQVLKVVEQQRDFFADPEQLESDQLEEKAILYRIGREIKIDRALQKLQKKST